MNRFARHLMSRRDDPRQQTTHPEQGFARVPVLQSRHLLREDEQHEHTRVICELQGLFLAFAASYRCRPSRCSIRMKATEFSRADPAARYHGADCGPQLLMDVGL